MTIGVDAPRVANEDEALILMLHHLQFAAMYFEATPSVIAKSFAADEFSKSAIDAWLGAMEALYPAEEAA